MTSSDDLSVVWAEAEARLPSGWSLAGLRCASTGLRPDQRSDDRIAVAVGPDSAERAARAYDPVEAIAALAASFERDDGVATVPSP